MSQPVGTTVSSGQLHTRGLVWRVVLLGGLWAVLSGGELDSWLFGVPAVALAAYASRWLAPVGAGWRLSAAGLARFVPFFLWKSLSGGTDVARRAFSPRMSLDPEVTAYEFRLPEHPARRFMAIVVSLLPGTLSTEVRGGSLEVHALVRGPGVFEDLELLEYRVGDLFGLELSSRVSEEAA